MRFVNGVKRIVLNNDREIHLHYANNKGRGSNNVTITIVKTGCPRPTYTRKYDDYADMVMRQYRTSGWRGIVNIPNDTIRDLGGIRHYSK